MITCLTCFYVPHHHPQRFGAEAAEARHPLGALVLGAHPMSQHFRLRCENCGRVPTSVLRWLD